MLSSVFGFFFSSRRRHTRFDCDWSSDVCSSDLVLPTVLASRGGVRQIVVVDATTGPVGARITHLLNDSPMFRAQRVPASGEVVDSLTTEVEQKRLGGFLIVTRSPADSGKGECPGAN